jgi:hypothetical protein
VSSRDLDFAYPETAEHDFSSGIDAPGPTSGGADELKCLALEPSWPPLPLESEKPARGPNLESAGARVIDRETFARTRIWSRRGSRAWVRCTSRVNAN